MLRKLFLRRTFGTVIMKFKDPKGQSYLVKGEEGKILANALETASIALPFDCGFSCECSTCSIVFKNEEDFDKIREKCPISPDETLTLHQSGKMELFIHYKLELV